MPAGFTGRAEELRALAGFVRGAGERRAPAVALVHGPAGMGKTRLLAEACAQVPATARVCVAGYDSESAIPLAAARDLLRLLSGGPEGALVDRLLFASPPGPVELFQVFEAAFRSLRDRPALTVVVDDVQWVDATSVALLHYLIRAAETTAHRLTVVVAGRPTGALPRFAASLGEVVADPLRLLRIALGPLSRADGIALARSLVPEVAEREAAQMWEAARGSPFWLEVLARERAGEKPGGPLAGRLGSATREAVAVLEVLAVAGRPLDRSALAGIDGRPRGSADRAAAELLDLGLATEADGAMAVSHDLVREQVAAGLPPERWRQVHRRLAAWLEERATNDGELLEAVTHGRRGGLSVLGPALRLATSPRRRLLGGDTADMLLAVAADHGWGTPDGAALGQATAQLMAELGRHDAALAAWSSISRHASAPALRAEAALAAAECAFHLGRAAESERLLTQADRTAGADARTAIAVDAGTAAVQLWLRHRGPEGQEAADRAVQRAQGLAERAGGTAALSPPERQVYLRAFLAAAEAAILADRPGDVLQLTDEVAAVAVAEDTRVRIRALTEGALAQRWLGRNAEAEARLSLAWEEARAEALPQATAEVGALFARVLYSRGRLAQAAEVLDECTRLGARLAEYCPSRAISPIVGHLLEASRGDWRAATAGLRSAAGAETDPHYRAHVHLERALVTARYDPRRHRPAVHADVRAALADAAESGCLRCGVEVRARSAEALARIGDPAAARELLATGAPDPRNGNRALQWWADQALAAVLGAEGATGPAVAAWAATVAEAERCGMVLEALWARLDLGLALTATDRAAAAVVLRVAGEAADAMGAATELRVAEQMLRALGVRTWRRTAGTAPAVWTAREHEIVRRVAAGASNAEIAAELFLSRKTVERHVSNVLAKSGLRNRAELAAAWSSRPSLAPHPEGVHR